MKLFICYRSLDATRVDTLVAKLSALKKSDNTLEYEIWQDKKNILGGQNWWKAIIDAITECDVFVFHISKESLKSEVCKSEFNYALQCNIPIVPVILDGEYFYNEHTDRFDISYWNMLPDKLIEQRSELLFSDSSTFVKKFNLATRYFVQHPKPRLKTLRPTDPRLTSETASNGISIYDEACDYAGRLELSIADKLFRKLIDYSDENFSIEAVEWIEILRQYGQLLDLDSRTSTRFRAQEKWNEYTRLFPKNFLKGMYDNDIFDPKELKLKYGSSLLTQVGLTDQQSETVLPKLNQFYSIDIVSQTSEWINIQSGNVKLIPDDFDKQNSYLKQEIVYDVSAFVISKYPITNAQYARFIVSGGYNEKRWWPELGWNIKQTEGWKEPLLWRDADWNSPKQPVVGVSWYECVAFCSWLSEVTNERITLPTEQQWQRAAQGQTDYVYPWGNYWNSTYCNNSVALNGNKHTTPVDQYEGKGESPLGVVDMVGNVWEWCITSYGEGTQQIELNSERRILKGGSWRDRTLDLLCVTVRTGGEPNYRDSVSGFRCVRY